MNQSESPRPTKESMGELVRNYGVAEYNCGEWNGNPAGRGLFREAQTRMTATRAALLSAIDRLIDAENRLREIASIIERVDNRAMAADGPVTPTLQEMRQEEISRIYELAKGTP